MNFKTLAPHAARVVSGLVFVVFGLNHLLHFLPAPPLPVPAAKLAGAFVESGYLMGLVGLTEVVCGALLLSNRLVPLALVVLAPVMVKHRGVSRLPRARADRHAPRAARAPGVPRVEDRQSYTPLFRSPHRTEPFKSGAVANAA